MTVPPTYSFDAIGDQAKFLAKQCGNERMAMVLQYVALGSMIIMAGYTASKILNKSFGHLDQDHGDKDQRHGGKDQNHGDKDQRRGDHDQHRRQYPFTNPLRSLSRTILLTIGIRMVLDRSTSCNR